jgi:hypothetical protein
VGDKTPDYVRSIPTLHQLWPDARFVHVIRDGRDVALSMADWPKVYPKPAGFATWSQDRMSTIALWWEHNVRSGQQAGRVVGADLYYEVRYELLVSNPENECRALSEFLDVQYDPSMLHFHDRGTDRDPGLDKTRSGLPVTAGLRSWQEQMLVADLASFEAAAGGLLDDLGYSRVLPSPSQQTLETTNRIRSLLITDLKSSDEAWLTDSIPSDGRVFI